MEPPKRTKAPKGWEMGKEYERNGKKGQEEGDRNKNMKIVFS
jgi:hypothetical protein